MNILVLQVLIENMLLPRLILTSRGKLNHYKMLGIVLKIMVLKFKNYQLVKWCQDNEITFTRGRSYKKNDNCFVEEKNNSVVRYLVGYYRYEGKEALEALEKLYKLWCLLVNYFFTFQ